MKANDCRTCRGLDKSVIRALAQKACRDLAIAPRSEAERRDFWEICEDRCQTRSTILTSQLPVARWHEQIGNPAAADGILDRLVHHAHRIDMRGESMRKKRSTKPTD